MTEKQFTNYIMHGHALYWDMLGNMRGNDNHKSDVCWLSGDINFSYATLLGKSNYIKQIEDIITRIENKEIPNNLTISPDSAPDDVDVLDCFMKTGLFKTGFTSLGMAKILNDDTVFPKPKKCLNIFRVNDLCQLKMCGAILNAAFEYDLFSYEHYLDAFNMNEVKFYIAEYNGLPVSACMSIVSEEIVDIAWVGTLNGYRKKGIAGSIMNFVEKNAMQNGISISVLTAFEGAVNTYKRIGYEGYCKIDVIDFIGGKKE